MAPLFAELFLDPAMMNYICKIFKISVIQKVICCHDACLNISDHSIDQNRRIVDILRDCTTVFEGMNHMIA